ncbi:membrane protein insertase YidC [Eubacteriales bacterium OttesenSCG-928-N13]|nr:membrane protein insertase YidC [Eubacteriales bacterium OttesenSCG-928-N13]
MEWIGIPMGAVLRVCYQLVQNYGLAIILFTVATKLILFPISLWVHVNGVKMVRIQPAINRLKIKYFGDKDTIADEQGALYKKEKYNPLSGTVPIIVQLILLIGLIQVIYHPLSYVLRLPSELVTGIIQVAHQAAGIDMASSSVELLALNCLQTAANPDMYLAIEGMTQDVFASLQGLNMNFLGFNLAGVPIENGGILLLIPILAGLAAVVLSLFQNKFNPLQAEQGKIEQLGSMLLSVGISLVVGFFVPAGVGFYWICSNLLSIVQQVVLNIVYKPKQHIDYDELAASKAELAQYQGLGEQGTKHSSEEIKREKQDYKRFFSIVNKHLVFYSEGSGFYKFFEKTILYILSSTNITIHYVTSDPNDQIFQIAKTQPQIKPYYIGEKKLVTLFMRMEADVVVMTMTDLENYHYKRSYMSKDMEYVYMFHYPLSTHLVVHTGAFDHYDTILCVGTFQFDEIRQTEAVYNLPQKKLVAAGYGQLEKLRQDYLALPQTKREQPKVLIAPSWQEDNLLDFCLDDLLGQLLGKGFQVVVRPHPEYTKRYKVRLDAIIERYASYGGNDLSFELDFSSNASIYDSDVVVSDWSGTAYEFAFATEKPAVFVDTPVKIHNPEYTRIAAEPLEFTLRDRIGIRVDPAHMEDLADRIHALIQDDSMRQTIADVRDQTIANFGHSGEVSGQYIIEALQQHISARKTS